jgi:hypothetical protein
MKSRTVIIQELWRTTEVGGVEKLTFKAGVNVLVGEHNTGKTKWLETLDYLMGDDSLKEEEREHHDIYKKYDSVQMLALIAGESLHIERRWAPGNASKVIVNGQAITLDAYRQLLQAKLGIPEVHYPSGNPYRDQAWPVVGWRSLFRHIYRRQDSWGEVVSKQPPNEQHAALMQFLGVAEKLFSQESNSFVEYTKQIRKLEWQREQYVSMLQDLSRQLLDAKELGVGLTPQSIESAIGRLQEEEKGLQERRSLILESLRHATADQNIREDDQVIEDLSEQLVQLQTDREDALSAEKSANSRLEELKEYRELLAAESERMQRVSEAGSVLSDLQVTHCPACDQEVSRVPVSMAACYLCGQSKENTGGIPDRRIQFELEQLSMETEETDELIGTVEEDLEQLEKKRSEIDRRLNRVRQSLRPIRTVAAAILPPELALIDMETGRLQERVQQVEKVREALKHREELGPQILRIQEKIAALEGTILEKTAEVDFSALGDEVADGMNSYLNALNQRRTNAWSQRSVAVKIGERDFAIKVGDANWKTKLGMTLTLYFLLSYQYALMRLTRREECRYPGLTIIDFPAELLDGTAIADKENFIVEPFIDLLKEEGMEGAQLIAAGSSFEGLERAHRVQLTDIWK